MPVGKAPVQVGFTPDGRHCYVSLRDENSVAVTDTPGRRVITKVPLGPRLIQLFALPNGREFYVVNQGTEESPANPVSVIDTTTQKVIPEIITLAGAHGVAVSTAATGSSSSTVSPTLFRRSTPKPLARRAPFRWDPVPAESRSARGRDSKCQARSCWVSPPSRRLADALVVLPQEHPKV